MNRARAREGGGERDLRSYLTSTSKLSFNLETSIKNEQLVRSLVARTTECKRGVAYRPVDYVALFEKVQTTRNRDRERLVKVNHLSRKGELIRESGLLKTHKDIWKKEQSRLEYERQQLESDIEEWREHLGSIRGQFWREYLSETAAVVSQLQVERHEFVCHRIQPLWQMRGQLRADVERGREEEGGGREEVEKWREKMKKKGEMVMDSLKLEYNKVLDKIEETWSELERQREEEELKKIRGIPLDLSNKQEVPGYEAALKELKLLDSYYEHTLEDLHHKYETCRVNDGGWSVEEMERVKHIMGQYPSSLAKRRVLVIDRLMREFPDKTRVEIINLEGWYCALEYYNRHTNILRKSWKQNRAELVQRLVTMLREQEQLIEAKSISSTARAEQQKRLDDLYKKVCTWREEKEAAERKAEEERLREWERGKEVRQREELKMAQHRKELKAKLEMYRIETKKELEKLKDEERQRQCERDCIRLDDGRRDRERVEHRQQLLWKRQEKDERAKEKAMEAVKKREMRLEQLRKTVEVKATCDPQRVLKATKASERRVPADNQLDAQHPLFTLHGYRDDVVTSDPRFKVAAALQRAGLLNSVYARYTLATIPPSHPPRPDLTSTILK